MEQVLVVSKNHKSTKAIVSLLLEMDCGLQISTVVGAGEARRFMSERNLDLAIINAPLADENGIELSTELAQETLAGVMFIIGSEYAEEVASRVAKFGVFVVERPVNRSVFFRALRLLNASGQRVQRIKSENQKLKDKIDELKLSGQAKGLLIQNLHLTEREAHRYLEKQAMDKRIGKREMAKEIIRHFDDEYE